MKDRIGNDGLFDFLVTGQILFKRNEDGGLERCSPTELKGKELEIVSIEYIPFDRLIEDFRFVMNGLEYRTSIGCGMYKQKG